MSEDVDFEKAAEGIVDALENRSSDMSNRGRIHYVYNEAMDDAINFVHDLAKSNPQYRLAFISLERDMKHWLVLR